VKFFVDFYDLGFIERRWGTASSEGWRDGRRFDGERDRLWERADEWTFFTGAVINSRYCPSWDGSRSEF
jgi:hypothetical protein